MKKIYIFCVAYNVITVLKELETEPWTSRIQTKTSIYNQYELKIALSEQVEGRYSNRWTFQ
jgi:hypothetical protein